MAARIPAVKPGALEERHGGRAHDEIQVWSLSWKIIVRAFGCER